MATAQDVLRTVVQLQGAEQYQGGMRGMASATELAAQKQQILMQVQARQAASLGVLGASLMGLAGQWVKLAGTMEQSRIAFTTLLRSGSQAKQFVKDLQQFAAATPFEFMDLQAQAKRLLAFGFAAKDVIPMLRTLGDSIGALGGGQEVMGRTIIALGQMQAKGRIMGQEMLQLAEAGIPVYQILQDELGLTGDELKRVGEQGISSAKAIPALLKGLDKRYGGGMAAQFGTLNQQMSNLADQAAIVGAALGEGLIGPVKAAAGVVSFLGKALNGLSDGAKANIGFGVGLVGLMVTLKAATLGASAAKIGYNLLLAEQTRLTAQATTATLAQAAALSTVAAAEVAAGASSATRLWPSSVPLLGPGAGPVNWPGSGTRAGHGTAMRTGNAAAYAAETIASSRALAVSDKLARGMAYELPTALTALINPLNLVVGGLAALYMMYQSMVVPALKGLAESRASEKVVFDAAAVKLAGSTWSGAGRTWDHAPTFEEWQQAKYGTTLENEKQKTLAKMPMGTKTMNKAAMDLGTKDQAERLRSEWLNDVRLLDMSAAAERNTALRNAGLGYNAASATAEDYAYQGKYAEATGDAQAQITALQNEAQARRESAQAAWQTAAASTEEAERTKYIGVYREELLKSLGLENDAKKLGTDLDTKALEEVKKQSELRLTLAKSYSGYTQAIYGAGSAQSTSSLYAEASALQNESGLAASLGDVARSYDLAAQAAETYRKAAEGVNEAMNKTLGIGSAYVEYLRAIGQDKQADAFERNQMSSAQSSIARQLFAQGDLEGGYRAAAAAEKFARTGAKGGNLFGDSVPYSGRALTGAVPAGMGGVSIQVNNSFTAGPDYQKRTSKQVQADANQAAYYNTFTW